MKLALVVFILCFSSVALASLNIRQLQALVGDPYYDDNYHQRERDYAIIMNKRDEPTDIAGWTCNTAYYNATDGCDCDCGITDPDCSIPGATVYNCPNPGMFCVHGSCRTTNITIPSGWNCSQYNYANQDGCDCNCGAYDPDCDDSSEFVFNCVAKQYCDTRGQCQDKPTPLARLIIQDDELLTSTCGDPLNQITIQILDANYVFVNDTYRTSNYTVSVNAKTTDSSLSVSLVGTTKVAVSRGVAIFEGIIPLGPNGAEFYLSFTSDPPLIPVSSSFRIQLKTGVASRMVMVPKLGIAQKNSTYTVPQFTKIPTKVIIQDECGNIAKETVPDIACITINHDYSDTEYSYNGTFCPEADFTITENATISYEATEIGAYDVYMYNGGWRNNFGILGQLSLNIIPRSEFLCFGLQDTSKGVTGDDVANFDAQMIPNSTYAKIKEYLFSVDEGRPAVIAFNFTASNKTTEFHAALDPSLKQWVLSAKHFFVEQNPRFLTVISLSLVEVEPSKVGVNLTLPFCGSVTADNQRDLIGLWLYALSDAYAAFVSGSVSDVSQVRSTADVVCSGEYPNYQYCPRLELESDVTHCAAPQTSALTIALIVLSVVFAVIAAIYMTTLTAVFAIQNGAVYSSMEDFQTLSEDDFKSKRRLSFLFALLAPAIAICGTAQNVLLFFSPNKAKYLIILFEGIFVVTWYIVAFYSFYSLYVKKREPSKFADKLYFVTALSILFLSLFNIFWTFAWVTLGLLLNPERVVAYFVGFLTIFLVVAFKLQSLMQFMNTVEVELQKHLFKRLLKNETVKPEELEELLASTVDMDTIKLRAYLETKGFNQKDIEVVARQIEKYRRFRVRFIIGNLIGSLFFLTSLIVFILLGVEAFRLKSGLVSGVGSVLEGFAGVGTAVNEKMGDNQQKVRELVEQFAKRKTRASVVDDAIPLQNVNLSISGLHD